MVTTAQDLVPIELELPEAMFVGTPTNLAIENLEKPLGRPREPFLAPAGTKNVSLGKPVTSTDDFPIIGELEMITDGDKNADDGYFVELGPFTQHATIDLENEYISLDSDADKDWAIVDNQLDEFSFENIIIP